MTNRERLSATIDSDLLDAARAAVQHGQAPTVSEWVNSALRLKADHDAKLRALDEFLSEYEAEHGEITEAEMAAARRRARSQAIVVRGRSSRPAKGAA